MIGGCYAWVPLAASLLPPVPPDTGFEAQDLLRSVVSQESTGNPMKVSPTGAKGCGQLTRAAVVDIIRDNPGAAKHWKWQDAKANVAFTAAYLRNRLQAHGNYWQAVRHYYGCGVDRLPGHPTCDQYAAEVWGRAKMYYQARQQLILASGE